MAEMAEMAEKGLHRRGRGNNEEESTCGGTIPSSALAKQEL